MLLYCVPVCLRDQNATTDNTTTELGETRGCGRTARVFMRVAVVMETTIALLRAGDWRSSASLGAKRFLGKRCTGEVSDPLGGRQLVACRQEGEQRHQHHVQRQTRSRQHLERV